MDRACEYFGDRLEVRFYAHYQSVFDAKVLARIPHVRFLSLDCLRRIVNEDEIARLPALERFLFGVFEYDRPELLKTLDLGRLKRLGLAECAKRNFDLSPLAGAAQLEDLFIQGFTNNIECIGSLPKLARLRLSSIAKTQDLGFVSRIANLRSLQVILGGRQFIDEVAHPGLQELEVIRVRGLETLGSLARFPGLRTLSVEDQLQLRSVDLAAPGLQRLMFNNCKNLSQLDRIETLGALVELRVGGTALDLHALATREWPESLAILRLHSGKKKSDDTIREILARRGFGESASPRP